MAEGSRMLVHGGGPEGCFLQTSPHTCESDAGDPRATWPRSASDTPGPQ